MEDQTNITRKGRNHHDSNFWGISIRGWICLMVVGTVCFMSAWNLKVEEPLYTLATVVAGYYFGQQQSKNSSEQQTK